MDVIRRNTDYAIRAMLYLSRFNGKQAVSARKIAESEGIPYQLAPKLMQQLKKAKLIESSMGAKGGFKLKRRPSSISLMEIIGTIQGPLELNRCLINLKACERVVKCPVRKKLAKMQKELNKELLNTRLSDLINTKSKG
jgi:Rrf2 family iron-sulfur cluster assembly transcriptional regulator